MVSAAMRRPFIRFFLERNFLTEKLLK